MPVYQYKCNKCEQEFVVPHPMGDTTVHKCKQCDEPLQRLFNIGAVAFKGGGWGSSNS